MKRAHFDNVIDILERGADTQLADSLEMIGSDNIEAIAVMADNMRLTHKSEAQITDNVVHDVAGFLENEEGFTPICTLYK